LPGATPLKTYACPLAAVVGDLVYASGNSAVELANATSSATAPAIGFIREKPTPTTCHLQKNDEELGGFSGLVANTLLFLSTTDGKFSDAPPSSSNAISQVVGRAVSDTTVLPQIDGDFIERA
jgi:hypothetical protein